MSADANLRRAQVLLEQSRPDLAERELRQGLAAEPNNPTSHALLALILAEGDRLTDATDEAQAAIRLAPDLPLAHMALSRVMHARGRLDEAEAAINEAIRLNPEQPDYLSRLAAIEFERRRWQAALSAAERALQLDPQHVTANNLRAMALVQLGRRDEAGQTIAAALARDPDNALTHANQGWALLHAGQAEPALEHFREALRLDPTLDWAREGVVEALKARHRLYGLLLRYFLWMSRLSPRAQWGVIIGAVVVTRLLPVIAPFYIAFAVLTWVADPLFNLLLRLDKFGRLALSAEQVRTSNWVGGCLLVALVTLVAGVATRNQGVMFGALAVAALALPIAATFRARRGWPRRAMAVYTTLVAAVVALGLAVAVLATGRPESTSAASGYFGLALLGVILSGWVANALAMVRLKR